MIDLIKYEFKNRYRLFLILLTIYLLSHLYFFNQYKDIDLDEIRADALILTHLLSTTIFHSILFFSALKNFNSSLKAKEGYMLFMTNKSKVSIYFSKVFYHFIEVILLVVTYMGVFAVEVKNANLLNEFNLSNDFSFITSIFNTPKNLVLFRHAVISFYQSYMIIFLFIILIMVMLKSYSTKQKFLRTLTIAAVGLFYFLRDTIYFEVFKLDQVNADGLEFGLEVGTNLPKDVYIADSVIILIILIVTPILLEKKVSI